MKKTKNKSLSFHLYKKTNLILYSFFLIIILLFFLKSLNYSIYWVKYFTASFNKIIDDQIFWDFEVYKCAISKLILSQNPYTLITECSPSKKAFIHNYPLLSTFIFLPFVTINFFWSKFIWGIILLFSFISYLIYQKKLYLTNIHYVPYALIILFCLDKTFIYSFFTGNISFLLQILLSCSFYFLYKKKIKYFFHNYFFYFLF